MDYYQNNEIQGVKGMLANQLYEESEEKLLQRIKAGDYSAFDVLYAKHWSTLYGMAYNILRDHSSSKDIVQDIFIWFWEHREQWNLTSSKGYLLTAVRFKTLNYIKANKARAEFYLDVAKEELSLVDEETLLEVQQLEEMIRQITSELPERCSEVFYLSRFQHLSNKEIAEKLHISEKTVEGHITLAIKKLRQQLAKGKMLLYLFV